MNKGLNKVKPGTTKGASSKLITVRFAPMNNTSVQRQEFSQSPAKGGSPVARKMFDPLAGP
ncbi:MAG TPA: hypothetical protein V6C89_07650 [Drouetiella sp.]|jgi:hypothetical protein